ncbi:MAG TPA: RNA polymerase sigma factor [Methylobacter sp.]|jgi:RNA polymerase sigma-70 factor (ECF subfamily)
MVELPIPQLSTYLNEIAQGNPQAIGQIYRHYQIPLFAYVRHLVIDDSIAKDIVHETFLTVSQKHQRFDIDGNAKFSTWLCGIAKNKVRTLQRSGRRFIDVGEDFLTEYSTDHSWDLSRNYEDHELSEIMQGCIDKLPEPQREATYWVYYKDMLQEDVAKQFATSLGTIKTRLLHARAKIRDCLGRLDSSWSNKR